MHNDNRASLYDIKYMLNSSVRTYVNHQHHRLKLFTTFPIDTLPFVSVLSNSFYKMIHPFLLLYSFEYHLNTFFIPRDLLIAISMSLLSTLCTILILLTHILAQFQDIKIFSHSNFQSPPRRTEVDDFCQIYKFKFLN